MKMEVIKISVNEMIVNATKNYANILENILSEGTEVFDNMIDQFRQIIARICTENFENIKALFIDGSTFQLLNPIQKALVESLDEGSHPYMIMITNAKNNDILGVVVDEVIQW